MRLDFDITVNAMKYFAVFARITAFTMSAPMFNSNQIPKQYKALLALILTFIMVPLLPAHWQNDHFEGRWTLTAVICMIASEVFFGLTISLFVKIMLETFSFAGSVVDRQMGFTMLQTIDPLTEINSTAFSSVFTQVFTIVFLGMNGHHEIIGLIVLSFDSIGPAGFTVEAGLAEAVIESSAMIFMTGMRIAMPIFVATIFVSIAMGLISRIGQDFPVLMLSFPLRIGMGMIMLLALFPLFITICRDLNNQMLSYLLEVSSRGS